MKYEGIGEFIQNKGGEQEKIFYHTLFDIKSTY